MRVSNSLGYLRLMRVRTAAKRKGNANRSACNYGRFSVRTSRLVQDCCKNESTDSAFTFGRSFHSAIDEAKNELFNVLHRVRGHTFVPEIH